jgi:hypothetical protein
MSDARLNAFGSSWGQSQGSSGSRFSNSVSKPPAAIPQPRVSPASTMGEPQWLSPVKAKLHELSALRRNWDSRGSASISPDITEFTITILARVMPPNAQPPSIIPMGRGELQLIWDVAGGELEAEVIKPNEVVAYYLDRSTGQEQEWHMTTQFSRLSDILWSAFRD